MPRAIMLEPISNKLFNAHEFGTITYLFEPGERKSVFDTGKLAEDIQQRLSDIEYCVDTDYIVMTGHFQAVCILMSTVGNTYGIVHVLMFDSKQCAYVQRDL